MKIAVWTDYIEFMENDVTLKIDIRGSETRRILINQLRMLMEQLEKETILDKKWDEPVHSVTRFEDNSPSGRMNVIYRFDGDVAIQIVPDREQRSGNPLMPTVGFRMPNIGGGHSPHTRLAIIELIKAIERDNEENPQNFTELNHE